MANSKKILLRGYFGHRNLGDDLLFLEALDKCPQQYKLYALGDEEALKEFQHRRPFTVIGKKREIFSHHFLATLFFGGGQFPNRKYSFREYLSMRLSFVTSNIVVMNGLGIVPKIGSKSNFWFKRMLNSVDHISVRDDISLEYVKGLGVRKEIHNCGDLYWGSSTPEASFERRNVSSRTNLLICLGEPFSPLELQEDSYSTRYDAFVGVLQDAIAYLIGKGYRPTFVPFFDGSDSKIIDNICSDPRIKDPTILAAGRDFELSQIDEIFRSAGLGICMRFHSKVLAIKNELPFVGICYDFKSVSLLQESNLTDVGLKYGIRESQFFGEEFDISFEQMKETIDYVTSHAEQLRMKMPVFSEGKRYSVLKNHKRVFELLDRAIQYR